MVNFKLSLFLPHVKEMNQHLNYKKPQVWVFQCQEICSFIHSVTFNDASDNLNIKALCSLSDVMTHKIYLTESDSCT